LLCVNAASAGPLVAAWLDWRAGRMNDGGNGGMAIADSVSKDGEVSISNPTESHPDVRTQAVKEGGLLVIRKHSHAVRSIVPSDPEKKLIGWIEIDQKSAQTDK
jgi:hypothetical protein